MPKGFHTPDKKKEQGIVLAQTSLTQQEIAEQVGISRRTLVRIWDKAGVSPDRKHIRDIATMPQGKKDDTTTRYSEVLRDRHIEELLTLAEEMRKYLTVPSPFNATAWCNQLGVRIIAWQLPGSLCPPIKEFTLPEEKQALLPHLQAHMDDPVFWRDLEALNEEATTYCYDLRNWVATMEEDAYDQTGLCVLQPGQEGIAGLTYEFFNKVFSFAATIDEDNPSVGPWPLYQPGHNVGNLSALTIGRIWRSTIAWAPEDDHEHLIDVHKCLVTRMAGQPIRELQQRYASVGTALEKLRFRLLPAAIRPKVARGHCGLCP